MLQETNRAFVLRAVKDVVFEDRPVPELKDPWDVRVQVAQTGICGSDVHYWQRGRIGGKKSSFFKPASETSLLITKQILSLNRLSSSDTKVLELSRKLGRLSRTSKWEIGSPLNLVCLVDSTHFQWKFISERKLTVRSCDYCRSGSYNLCPDTVFAATPPHDGTLSKYYTTQADFCYPLPAHMDLEEGALVEPVAVAVQISKVGNVRPDQTVVVFGCGPIGLLCQAVSKSYAARKVIGVDISQARAEFARTFGADGVFIPPAKADRIDDVEWSEQVARTIKQEFDLGEGPDVVLEATGAQPCIQTGVHLTKKGGTYVQAGMGREVSSSTVDLP